MAHDSPTSRYGKAFPAGRWIALASLLALMIFLGLAWHVFNTFHAGVEIKDAYLRGERLHDQFDSLQKQLEVAVALAAGTGADSWSRKYADARQRLDSELASVRANPWPGYDAPSLDALAEANERLRRTEDRALALAREGRPAEAFALLAGPEYQGLYAKFNAAATAFINAHERYLDTRLQAEARREAWSLGSAVAIFVIVLMLWLRLITRLRHWHAALLDEADRREQAQEELAATAGRYRALFEQGFDGILLVAPDHGNIVDCNRHAAAMLGYTRDQLLAMRLDDVEGTQSANSDARLELPRRPAPCQVGERRYRRKDGSLLPVETGECAVEVDGASLHQIRIRDLSERDQLRDALAEAQKLEAVGQLAGGLAHDFNNLLTVIHGYVYLARQKLAAGQPALQELAKLEEAARQAGDLTRSLLTVGSHTAHESRPVDVVALIREVRGLLRGMLPESIKVGLRSSPDSVWVEGDHTQLTQVLLNLAINARDAMPDGGRIELGVELAKPGSAGFRTLAGQATGAIARVWVKDDGCGMNAELQRRVFEPFFTTKPRGQGTGLGLAVVRGIVHSHGGDISLESAPGAGTTAIVYLPTVAPGAIPSGGSEMARAQADPGAIHTVVLAEGHRYVREILADSLEAAGFRVVRVSAGDGLLQALEDSEVNIALVIADADLPGCAGQACLDAMRARGIRVPAVLMADSMSEAQEDELAGQALVLRKPFVTAELIRIARRLIGAGARP